MARIDISFEAEEVRTTVVGRSLDIDVTGVEETDLLDQISLEAIPNQYNVSDVVAAYGIEAVLDAVGIDEAKSHWSLQDAES